jgi:hypothetical protein
MVALESPAPIPQDVGGPAEAQRAKPALPGAGGGPENLRGRGSCGGREGHH